MAARILQPNRMVHGYTCVHLYAGGKASRRVRTLHQLVAEAFIPNPNGCREVNHKDFDKANNRLENLEWVTRRENVMHAVKGNRRAKHGKRVKGINPKTGEILSFESQIEAEIALRGRQTGLLSSAMKHNRRAYGFVWWRE